MPCVPCQVLFLDTPGVHKPLNELGTAMNASVVRALADADVVVVMADPTRALGQEDTMVCSPALGPGSGVRAEREGDGRTELERAGTPLGCARGGGGLPSA